MYVQENLTTTPYEVPGVSWELPVELAEKFKELGAFAKLVLDADRTRIVDIVEDCVKRAEAEAAAALEEQEDAALAERRRVQTQNAMLEEQGVKVLSRALFRQAAPTMTTDEVIQCRALAAEWAPGAYQVGDVRCVDGTPFRCVQAHDSSANPDWNPEQARALWAPYHGTEPETALPWTAPTGAHDIYKTGECMIWTDGRTLRAKRDTSFGPDENSAAWEEIDDE